MNLEPIQQELFPIERIGIETGFSPYPFHILSKSGNLSIEVQEENEKGKLITSWEISANKKYGHPRILAYKIDTIIINRKIDDLRPNIPRLIKLGSIRDICRQLGINEGQATKEVKKALHQNASAYITASIYFKDKNNEENFLEFGATRYTLILTGRRLPDGRKADAVYILLNELYHDFITKSQTRPLDYEYLKKLTPSAQRFYELISPQIYSHVKNKLPCAIINYSEICTYAPLTRYYNYDQIKKQMYKIHKQHKESGYIESVEIVQIIDKQGVFDCEFRYVAGKKAKEEFRIFSRSQKKGVGVRPENRLTIIPEIQKDLTFEVEKIIAEAESETLFLALQQYGVSETKAKDLIKRSKMTAEAQILYYPYLAIAENVKNPSGWIIRAIENNYAPPESFKKEKAEIEARRQEETNKKAEDSKFQKELKTFEETERKKELAKGKFESFSEERQTALFDKYKTKIIERDYKPEHLSLSFVQGLIDQQTYNEIYNDISAGKTF
jgi:hypothetical protein